MDLQDQKPRYFLSPDDPVIEGYRDTFEHVINKDTNSLHFDVPPGVVEDGDVSIAQELILALQHYPEHIEKMLFALEFKFEQFADTELYIPEPEWKSDAKYSRWFQKMMSFPVMLFFVHDNDARFYMLAGDFLADGKIPIVEIQAGRAKAKVEVKGEVVQQMCNRLFISCHLMLIYCHGSGFDAQSCIESILADFNLPVTYGQILAQYKADIENGINFNAGAS